MKILAIDTAERQFSVAALNHDCLLEQIVFDPQAKANEDHTILATGTQSTVRPSSGVAVELIPAIQRLLARVDWRMREVELLAVAKGPGSFTGLRTGVVAAKTLAYANKIPIQGANTLEAMAAQLGWFFAAQSAENRRFKNSETQIVHCVINAQRQQLFAGEYEISIDAQQVCQVSQILAPRVLDRNEWLAKIGSDDWVTGSGLKPVVDQLTARDINIAPSELWNSLASSIGRLAVRDFLLGQRDDLWTLEPIYFRPSYADEKADEKLIQ